MRRCDPFGWRLVKFSQNKLQIQKDEGMTLREREIICRIEIQTPWTGAVGICCERETDRGMDRYHFQSITQL